MRDLIPRNEFGTMATRLLNEFWDEVNKSMSPTLFSTGIARTHKFSYPKMNIRSFEDSYVIEAAVPGLKKDDIQVAYADGLLTITGESQNETNNEDSRYWVIRELHKSSFTRSINIDESVCDTDNISAEVLDGILVVKIPKKQLDTPENKRIIEVK
jgi:HSP20 family protein